MEKATFLDPLFRFLFHLFGLLIYRRQKEDSTAYRIIDVAVLRFPRNEDIGKRKFKAKYMPHFGLIFNISEEMIAEVLPEGIFRFLIFLLPWHRNPDEWDFVELGEGKYLLLVPKVYALWCLLVLTFFIRLVTKQKTGAAKA